MATRFFSKRNLDFMLYEVFEAEALTRWPDFRDHNRKVFEMVIDAAAKLAKTHMHPFLQEMDQHPPTLENGRVRVHPAVKTLLRLCGEGEWISMSFPYEQQGQQIPMLIGAAVRFIFAAANYSIGVYPELTAGACRLITSFGDESLIKTYAPRMLAGKWQGTMALTEPQAGSSLGDIETVAEPTAAGWHHIKGRKIFISAGDHDGVENVVHLLLAKIPGGPPGAKGISLFVVPRERPTADGGLEANDVIVSQIYHKLGYRGAPITELCFGDHDNCRGYLVGAPHQGLTYMFQMMNEARVGVGLGAAGIASAAYHASLEYARLRVQGRRLAEKDPSQPQIPILRHADVKRMLLFQRAVVEGSLALLMQCCLYADLEKNASGPDREKYRLLLDILTPVAKTYPAEAGILSVSQGLQCLGGYGYCDDFPLELFYRDARIHPIHEGTTGVQGMDLLGRKVIMHNGEAFKLLLEEISRTLSASRDLDDLTPLRQKLSAASDTLTHVTQFKLEQARQRGVEVFLADAVLYLELFALVVAAWQWLKQAIVVQKKLASPSAKSGTDFYQGKMMAARYFYAYEVPKIKAIAERLTDPEALTVEMEERLFTD